MIGKKPSRRQKTPQEAKRLSLSRDRRSDYGNNDKAARKAVPRLKAASTRAGRHGVKQALSVGGAEFAERDEVRVLKSNNKSARPVKQKSPGATLAETIERKLRRREARVGGKAKRAVKVRSGG